MSSSLSDRFLRSFPSFPAILVFSILLRVGLIIYSEWHDAHSVVKYTDVDYRVFSDATRFVLNPGPGTDNRAQGPLNRWFTVGDPYTRETYRYTPLLAILLAPNEWVHKSFGKFLFAACDILAGILINKLLISVVLPRKPSAVPPSHPQTQSSASAEATTSVLPSPRPSSGPEKTERRSRHGGSRAENALSEPSPSSTPSVLSPVAHSSDPDPDNQGRVGVSETVSPISLSPSVLAEAAPGQNHGGRNSRETASSWISLSPPSSSSTNAISSIIGSEETRRHAYATLITSSHLLSPFVFTISTRGSSESVLLLLVLLTLFCALRARWDAAAVLLGLSVHWKIYPVVYGVACVGVIGRETCDSGSGSVAERRGGADGQRGWMRIWVNGRTIRFAVISAGTFFALGLAMYAVWGYPFLHETYLYHIHRLDHRHNFSPYFYLIYLSYPGLSLPPPSTSFTSLSSLSTSGIFSIWRAVVQSPLTSFGPQMILSLGTGVMFGKRREDLPFAWFVQTVCFVVFNKVCTSQYFLWYLVFLPFLVPRLSSISARQAIAYAAVWMCTQALWLSQAYRLEFLGEDVFWRVWACGLIYMVGHCWVLGGLMEAYGRV